MELERERKPHMLMDMRNALNPNSYVDRQYIPRKTRSKGLMSAEDVAIFAVVRHENYVNISCEFFLTDASMADRIWKREVVSQ